MSDGTDRIHPARRLWQHCETIHAVTYFAPEVADALAATGIRGWWRGYFAARSGPLGVVPAPVVQALFHGFAPALVHRSLPSAWEHAGPAAAMAARDGAVEAVLGRLIGVPDPRLVALTEQAVGGCSLPGRPLFAAHAAHAAHALHASRAGSPEAAPSPLLRLWWACTLLREHRGDGHVAVLTAHGLDGCEANQLAVLDGVVPAARQQDVRGWGDDEWDAAGRRAAARPQLFRARIEAATDELARGPVDALGPDGLDELCDLLRPVVDAIAAARIVPYPNPVGLPALT